MAGRARYQKGASRRACPQRRASAVESPFPSPVGEGFHELAPALALLPSFDHCEPRVSDVMPVTNPYESSLGLSASPSAPFWARRHTGDVLDQWGVKLDGLAELVVTELITNGVKASGVKLDLDWNEPIQPAEGSGVRGELPRSAGGQMSAMPDKTRPGRPSYTEAWKRTRRTAPANARPQQRQAVG
jgi:hypothetical protein